MTTAPTPDLAPDLDASATTRLETLLAAVTEDPSTIGSRLPAVARTVARGPADPEDPDGFGRPVLEDQARVALLAHWGAVVGDPEAVGTELAALYRFGDADEKRAVVRALPVLPVPEQVGLEIVADALRTNDTRLVGAATGRYAADHLDADAWRQSVLKCLFVGVPVRAVADLAARADDELARMAVDYARERVAAGRPVPADLYLVLRPFPDATAQVRQLADPTGQDR